MGCTIDGSVLSPTSTVWSGWSYYVTFLHPLTPFVRLRKIDNDNGQICQIFVGLRVFTYWQANRVVSLGIIFQKPLENNWLNNL